MLAAMTAHGLLVATFGVGIWRSAGRSRSLRWVGPLLIASSIVGFFTHVVFPMSSRGMEASFTDTMHIICTGVWSLLITPWAGGFERINADAFFAWLIVLAVTVMRRSLGHVTPEKGVTEVAQTKAPSLVASR